MRKQFSLAVALLATALVIGCGGDGGDGGRDGAVITPPPPPPTSGIPENASSNSMGFVAYLMLLVASSADGLEPVDISGFTAPTSEQEEPASI